MNERGLLAAGDIAQEELGHRFGVNERAKARPVCVTQYE